MAGVLNFTLGLATGNFISNANRATQAGTGIARGLLGMSGVGSALSAGFAGFASAHAAVEKLFGAFENGSRLEALSRRTGESVGNLFSMEKGLKAVALPADSAATLIFQMQKSLGGMNEMGEPTGEMFKRLGLNIEDLKKMDAPAAFEKIGRQLATLNASEATNIASKIFGRGGAGDALQAARGMEDFAAAVKRSADGAALFERNAKAFHDIERSLQQLSGKGNSFFAGIAEGAAPGIQMLLDKLNTIDLTAFGKRFGDVLAVGTEAFAQGEFADLFELSLRAGIQGGSNFMLEKIGEWSKAIADAFQDPALKKGKMGFFENVGLATVALPQGLAGFAGSVTSDLGLAFPWEEKLTDMMLGNFQSWLDYSDEHGGWLGGKGLLDGVNANGTNVFANELKERFQKYLDDIDERRNGHADIMENAARAFGGADEVRAGIFRKAGAGGAGRLDVNSLERIGGLFNVGGGNRSLDYARRTADGVGTTNQLLRSLIAQTKNAPPATPPAHAD